jgi:hypothetical protein
VIYQTFLSSISFDALQSFSTVFDIFGRSLGADGKEVSAMNIGERIALLQEEANFEDDRQEVLYQEFHKLCDPWPIALEKNLTFDQKQELLTLDEGRRRRESEALARPPESLAWNLEFSGTRAQIIPKSYMSRPTDFQAARRGFDPR